jgi:6-phospho-3-hexuloisomerase
MTRVPSMLDSPSLVPESAWKSVSIQAFLESIINELKGILTQTDEESTQQLVEAIFVAKRIVVHGSGRMGIMSSAFAMRLAQLGFKSHVIGEPTTPALGKDDLLILSSSSGDTQMVYNTAVLAKDNCVQIALITARPDSRIGRLANIIVKLPLPNKLSSSGVPPSIQPMTTLSEQSLMLFFDMLVLLIMNASGQTDEDLWKRHFNLE